MVISLRRNMRAGFGNENIVQQRENVIRLKDEMLFDCLGIGDRKKGRPDSEIEF
jgi:hypothetical protein